MKPGAASAQAHPNIALVKYWGNRDASLRLPSNGSISMTLGDLRTVTRVRLDDSLARDELRINGNPASEDERSRTSAVLGLIRARAGAGAFVFVESESDFPVGAGLASSASAFASLVLAAASAFHLDLASAEISRLARRGSGSACRSVLGGFVEWTAGNSDEDSIAQPVAPQDYWDLVDVIAIVSEDRKSVGSSEGHTLAPTSPLQAARVADAPRRLAVCRQAIHERDFELLADLVEEDCHLMHAVMQTSHPPLLYWTPASLTVMRAVRTWRREGLAACYTLDAGPNVHCLTPATEAGRLAENLEALPGVIRLFRSKVGGPARLI